MLLGRFQTILFAASPNVQAQVGLSSLCTNLKRVRQLAESIGFDTYALITGRHELLRLITETSSCTSEISRLRDYPSAVHAKISKLQTAFAHKDLHVNDRYQDVCNARP